MAHRLIAGNRETARGLDLQTDVLSARTLGLFSLPVIYQRLTDLLDDLDSKTGREEIAEVIGHDPVLTARVLKAANSARYQRSHQINTVYDAVSTISDDDLRTLITTTTAIDAFSHIDTDLVDMDNFWNHSVCCGLAARILAEKCQLVECDRAFVAGILHDIGQLVIYHTVPALARQVLEKAGEPEEYRYRAEKEVIGITHAEVGAELLKVWGFPDYLVEVVNFHHEPDKARNYPIETSLVHISTGVVNRIEPSWKMSLAQRESIAHINPYAWSITGLSPAIIHSTLEDINIESFGVMCLIDPKSMFIF
jgi:putative nucleotidyltransferase with HDIG domain